jgi:hypothetical protein
MFAGLGILALIAIGGVALIRRRRAGRGDVEAAPPKAGAEAW